MPPLEALNVFLSFASDVQEETNLAGAVVKNINDRIREPLGLLLESTTWRGMAPMTPAPPSRIQDRINEVVRECNIFVLVLWKRFGSGNLAEEVEIAIERLKSQKRIMFLAYFRDLPATSVPDTQQVQVIDLRRRLQDQGIWFRSYSNPSEFKDHLTHDLYETVLRFRLSTSKVQAMRDLWQLGEPEKPTYPQLAIVYPPVDRRYLKPEHPDRFWLDRLVPHLVFEDFKAIQKIEKGLRLINFRKYRLFTTVDVPVDVASMNRVWLCWPRNARAIEELRRYSRVARFHFTPRQRSSEARIHWRAPGSSDTIQIRSPLKKYLELQRDSMRGGEWKAEMGRIVAKDFAIVARFTDERTPEVVGTRLLKDYFIGGIRGLGSWGAGWFIDRRYTAFRGLDENEDLQLLLEVICKDGRILDVRDVSAEPASYFRNENTLSQIRKIIRRPEQRP